jgi:hypothetical protein
LKVRPTPPFVLVLGLLVLRLRLELHWLPMGHSHITVCGASILKVQQTPWLCSPK